MSLFLAKPADTNNTCMHVRGTLFSVSITQMFSDQFVRFNYETNILLKNVFNSYDVLLGFPLLSTVF